MSHGAANLLALTLNESGWRLDLAGQELASGQDNLINRKVHLLWSMTERACGFDGTPVLDPVRTESLDPNIGSNRTRLVLLGEGSILIPA